MPFTIAIVGRPNVGKSTLFNRLAGRRLALVNDLPGLTRDRREEEIEIERGVPALLIDTAGLEDAAPESLALRMREQTEQAIDDADLVLFMIDARAGLIPADEAFAKLVRRAGKPVVLVANKSEGRQAEAGLYDAFALGLGDPLAVSAEHGEGLDDLHDAIARFAPAAGGPNADGDADAKNRPIRLAIVGRPNAGKSTLVNALLGEDRMITGPEAGITRDAISTDLAWRGRAIKLFDTAGLRRKARVEGRAEELAVGDALRAIRFAEVVVLLLDAEVPFEKQDLQIAALVAQEGRALVIAVNKWDLIAELHAALKELRLEAARLLPQVKGIDIVAVSALRERGLDRVMKAVVETYDLWNHRVPTPKLNNWLREAVEAHPPPSVQGRRIRLRFITQPNARPPTFVLFCSRPKDLPEAYKRYLVNALRETFALPAVPIRLHLRKGDNPYV